MIELSNVTKIYGKKQNLFKALKGVTLEIIDGASVAIIGKSGSGKSTIMHLMSGLDHPTDGTITIDGRNLGNMNQKEMDTFRATEMGFIFQSFFIEANQTCYNNVTLPLEIKGVRPGLRRKLVRTALDKVELSDKIDVKAGNLSGGQKQRLAIARAIVNKPKYIFADEPTGNLDTVTGDKIVELLFDLNKSLGSTLCIVTHDEELAAKCQFQVVIRDGEIAEIRQREKAGKR